MNDSVRKEIPFKMDLDSNQVTYNLGIVDSNKFSWRFHMVNSSGEPLQIDSIDPGCHCMSPKRQTWEINPSEVEPLDIDFDMEGYEGKIGRKVDLYMKSGGKKTLVILFELPKKEK